MTYSREARSRKISAAILFVMSLVFGTYSISIPANGQNWQFTCPKILDLQPQLPTPQVTFFTFSGTSQIFSRLTDGSQDLIKSPSSIIGCYADFAGIEMGMNGYHLGSINRDSNGYYWINAAGLSWRLTLDASGEFLTTDESNPYFSSGNKFILNEQKGLSVLSRGAFGFSPNAQSVWIGSEGFELPSREYSFGFSYYSNVWPLFKDINEKLTASAGVTWIYPRVDSLSYGQMQSLCKPYPEGIQSMEGGLGWSEDQFRYPTLLPKFKLNPVSDCYGSQSPNTPGWNFIGQELQKEKVSTLLISNKILVAPDGFTFDEESSGGLFGVATLALPLKELIPQNDRANIGNQAWTVFFNSTNFKGPVAIYPPQLWSNGLSDSSLKRTVTYDFNGGRLMGGALEWGGLPYAIYKDKSGNVFSKIPDMQFPADANGETVIMSDFRSYSKEAIFNPLLKYLNVGGDMPNKIPVDTFKTSQVKMAPLKIYQRGKQISPFGQGSLAPLLNGRGFGFKWNKSASVISLPSIYQEKADSREPIDVKDAPMELSNHSFSVTSPKSFVYRTPLWWNFGANQEIFEKTLADGSLVKYTWVKFIDQPGISALNLSVAELETLQRIAEDFHRNWSRTEEFMEKPTSGELAILDSKLMVVPPSRKEIGFVPLVISQSGKSKVESDKGLLNDTNSIFQKEVQRVQIELSNKQKLEAKKLAEARAQEEARLNDIADSKIATPLVKKKVTISCTKGSILKKVTGLKPKCPKGYKAKK